MAFSLRRYLGLDAGGRARTGSAAGQLKSVAEFLEHVGATLKGEGIAERVAEAAPWLGAIGEAARESLPAVKFVVKLAESLSKVNDPDQLAYLACTLAFQRSVHAAVAQVGDPAGTGSAPEWRAKPELDVPAEGMRFDDLRWQSFASSRFYTHGVALLDDLADALGYTEAQQRRLRSEVRLRFPAELKRLLYSPQTRERFAAFGTRLQLGDETELAHRALGDHIELQRRLYEEHPVFGEEPFSLADVYVDTQCGKLTWKTIRDRKRKDHGFSEFAEKAGGRHDLLTTVMDLIGDKAFDDAIVIQGPAGAGKSAFTLRLAAELSREGLKPIRVRFRDLKRTMINVMEALREAIRVHDDREDVEPPPMPRDIFLDGAIFDESEDYRGAKICPWVLILDGWDEVSVSAQGFRKHVEHILAQVRDRFVDRYNRPRVRVVLTGRPSTAVTESSFLKDKTRVLTLRNLEPKSLERHLARLAEFMGPAACKGSWAGRFGPVVADYREGWEKARGEASPAERARLEVLGLPLLAHLAVRLMVAWPDDDLKPLLETPTTLYRHLVDLTCHHGGRHGGDDRPDLHIDEDELRPLLREVAVAMTAYGRDAIPYDELEDRLNERYADLLEAVQDRINDEPLAALLVSFFFKGGHKDLGAEFTHKSFREFLFAEAIVEALKDFGRENAACPAEKPEADYWRDFESDDPRYDWSRRLGRLLGPQWITPEVRGHLQALITWEMERADALVAEAPPGRPTAPLALERWAVVRDGLADLWDWWGEGVHLRGQPRMKGKKLEGFDEPLVDEWVRWAMPQAVARGVRPTPYRTTTIDAHVGDGLCTLAALVHARVPESPATQAAEVRRYQSQREGQRVRFRPTGRHEGFFQNYCARINAAGFRPGGLFPSYLCFNYADFGRSMLVRASLFSCSLRFARLTGASIHQASFAYADLSNANLDYSIGASVYAHGCDFSQASLRNARWRHPLLAGSHLTPEQLQVADMFEPIGL